MHLKKCPGHLGLSVAGICEKPLQPNSSKQFRADTGLSSLMKSSHGCRVSFNSSNEEQVGMMIIRLLSPVVPTDFSGSGSHLMDHAPVLNVLLVGISLNDYIMTFPLRGLVNVFRGLKMYKDIFTDVELSELNDFVNDLRMAGQNVELSGDTFILYDQQMKGIKETRERDDPTWSSHVWPDQTRCNCI